MFCIHFIKVFSRNVHRYWQKKIPVLVVVMSLRLECLGHRGIHVIRCQVMQPILNKTKKRPSLSNATNDARIMKGSHHATNNPIK